MKIRWHIAVLLPLCMALPCRAALEFSAFLQTTKEFKFVITDLDANRSSGWIAIGQSFEGNRVIAFDPQKEVLSVRKGDSQFDLPLKIARVRKGQRDLAEMKKQIFKNLQMLSGTSEQYFMQQRVNEVGAAELMRYFSLKVPEPVDGEDYASLLLKRAVVVRIKTRSGIEVQFPENPAADGWFLK